MCITFVLHDYGHFPRFSRIGQSPTAGDNEYGLQCRNIVNASTAEIVDEPNASPLDAGGMHSRFLRASTNIVY